MQKSGVKKQITYGKARANYIVPLCVSAWTAWLRRAGAGQCARCEAFHPVRRVRSDSPPPPGRERRPTILFFSSLPSLARHRARDPSSTARARTPTPRRCRLITVGSLLFSGRLLRVRAATWLAEHPPSPRALQQQQHQSTCNVVEVSGGPSWTRSTSIGSVCPRGKG